MMTKSEIIATTLDQLIERFQTSPESFEYIGSDLPDSVKISKPYIEIIAWQTKLGSSDKAIQDPTAYQRTILVTFSNQDNSISVRIYNTTFSSIHLLEGQSPDGFIEDKRWFEKFRGNYAKFCKLRKLILSEYEHKKTKEFLQKMSSVFPTMLDHFFLGK